MQRDNSTLVFMNSLFAPLGRPGLCRVLPLLLLLVCGYAEAAPTIVSTVPPNGAGGVNPAAPVVITFSEAMNTTVTVVYLIDGVTYAVLPATSAWNPGKTLLTCTPTPALPPNRPIHWTVMNGKSELGDALTGFTGGTFTTAPSAAVVLTNAHWAGGVFSFDVSSSPGQFLTIEFSGTLHSNSWQTLLTTNSPGSRVHVMDPASSANPRRFYRARAGE